jgi:hypothetical protein
MIFPNLLYKPVCFNDMEVVINPENVATLYNWMSNTWGDILALLSQYDCASGKILIGGLGLGVIPLLISQKQTVSEVVVYEINQDVINCFNAQGFESIKMTIRHGNFYDAVNEGFDWVMPDYYNYPISDADLKSMVNLSRQLNLSNKNVFYLWERLYLKRCVKQKIKTLDLAHLHEYCEEFCLPKWTKQQAQLYLFDRHRPNFAPPNIIEAINNINKSRV